MPHARFHLSLAWICAVVVCVLVIAPARADKRMSDEDRGKQLYERHCIQCHGELAAGDGPATPDLAFEVPDLTEALDSSNRPENAEIVLDGKGPMPGFSSTFDKYDAKRVMRHMERACRDELPEDDEEEAEEEAKGAKAKASKAEVEPAGDAPAEDDDAAPN